VIRMILKDYEKALLNGDHGPEAKQLMDIMLKVVEVNGADGLVEVRHIVGNRLVDSRLP